MTIDTSAEALNNLSIAAADMAQNLHLPIGYLSVLRNISETFAALAAERAQPPADVVERVAYSIAAKRCGVDLTREQWQRHLAHYNEMCAEWPQYASASAFVNDAMRDATAAISALRPGDEIPAGVVVPRTLSAAMHEAFLLNVETHYDDLSERISITELDRGYDALLSAAKGGEQ